MDDERAVMAKIAALDVLSTVGDVQRTHADALTLIRAIEAQSPARACSLRTALHAAVLSARRRISAAEAASIRQSFATRNGAKASAPTAANPGEAPSALSQEISRTMAGMARTLADEIERADAAKATLGTSTRRLAAVGAAHAGPIDRLLGAGRALVASLAHRERRDRALLLAAAALYVAVLAYVVGNRLLATRALSFAYRIVRALVARAISLYSPREPAVDPSEHADL